MLFILLINHSSIYFLWKYIIILLFSFKPFLPPSKTFEIQKTFFSVALVGLRQQEILDSQAMAIKQVHKRSFESDTYVRFDDLKWIELDSNVSSRAHYFPIY